MGIKFFQNLLLRSKNLISENVKLNLYLNYWLRSCTLETSNSQVTWKITQAKFLKLINISSWRMLQLWLELIISVMCYISFYFLFLEVNPKDLECVFLKNNIQLINEVVKTYYDKHSAKRNRDAFAKLI